MAGDGLGVGEGCVTGAVSAQDGEQVLEVDARGGGCPACEGASGRRAAPSTAVRVANFMSCVS